jgi:hypothetical protein
MYNYNPFYMEGRGRKILRSRPSWAKLPLRPCLKNKIKTKDGVAKVVQYFPSKCEAPEPEKK